jgi:hypothetical protein
MKWLASPWSEAREAAPAVRGLFRRFQQKMVAIIRRSV